MNLKGRRRWKMTEGKSKGRMPDRQESNLLDSITGAFFKWTTGFASRTKNQTNERLRAK